MDGPCRLRCSRLGKGFAVKVEQPELVLWAALVSGFVAFLLVRAWL